MSGRLPTKRRQARSRRCFGATPSAGPNPNGKAPVRTRLHRATRQVAAGPPAVAPHREGAVRLTLPLLSRSPAAPRQRPGHRRHQQFRRGRRRLLRRAAPRVVAGRALGGDRGGQSCSVSGMSIASATPSLLQRAVSRELQGGLPGPGERPAAGEKERCRPRWSCPALTVRQASKVALWLIS